MKSRGKRVTTKDAAPNLNTITAADLGGRPSTHSSDSSRQVQESLVKSTASGYPAVVQRALQMVSFLRATVEPGAHMEPSVVDPNDESSNSGSSDDEDSNIDSGVCEAGQSKQESRSKSVVDASWDDSPDCQISSLNHHLIFVLWILVSRWTRGGWWV